MQRHSSGSHGSGVARWWGKAAGWLHAMLCAPCGGECTCSGDGLLAPLMERAAKCVASIVRGTVPKWMLSQYGAISVWIELADMAASHNRQCPAVAIVRYGQCPAVAIRSPDTEQPDMGTSTYGRPRDGCHYAILIQKLTDTATFGHGNTSTRQQLDTATPRHGNTSTRKHAYLVSRYLVSRLSWYRHGKMRT